MNDKVIKRYVVSNCNGSFLTPPRSTNKMYEKEAYWASLNEARIFNNKNAAINSKKPTKEYEILEVQLMLK
jgi:hypothetical protein